MANNDNSGKIPGFTMTDKELREKIEAYKAMVDNDLKPLPSWPDFCTFLGVSSDVLDEVMERGLDKKGNEKSAYYERALMLKSMGEWCEAQLVSNPNWGGKMAVKAMFLLKQGLGGTRKYADEKTQKITGPSKVELNFGGGDPRAKKAGK